MSDLLFVIIFTATMLITVVVIALIAESQARRAVDDKADRAAREIVQSRA